MAVGITQNDVWLAADALLVEGARPTIERVRQKMGRGSPNTVSPHLDSWFRSLGARLHEAGSIDAPAGAASRLAQAPDPVSQAAAQMWNLALRAARDSLAEQEAAMRAEIQAVQAQLQRDKEQVRQEALRLHGREQDLQDTIAMLKSQLQAAQARAQGLEGERQRASQQLADAAQLHRQTRQAHDGLLQRIETERADHAQQRERAEERSRAQEKRWLTELDAAREAARRLVQQHERQQKLLEARNGDMAKTLAQAQSALSESDARLRETQTGLREAAASAASHAVHIQALNAQLAQLQNANQQAFALHAAREDEWQAQIRQQHTQLQQAQQQLSLLLAQAQARERILDELRLQASGRQADPKLRQAGRKTST